MASGPFLSVDDIPLLLPPAEVESAQRSAVFRKLLTRIPFLGFGLDLLNTAHEERIRVQSKAQLAEIITGLWIFVKEHEDRLSALEEAQQESEVARDLVAVVSRAAGAKTPVVVDQYRGVTALLSLPMKVVPSEQVTTKLLEAYADNAGTDVDRKRVLDKANQMRRSMGDTPEGDDSNTIRRAGLSNRSADDFWFDAFEKARRIDSRMVACLLLAQSPDPFSEPARHDRDTLWRYLTETPPDPH